MTKKADKKEANFNPPLYVFGLDENGKPRGARFSEVRDDIVTAALDMKCWVVYPAPEDFVPLGMKLPVGRLYASGRAFIPNIRRDLYDKLFATKGKNAAFLEKAETDKTEGATLSGNASSPKVACVSPMTGFRRVGTASASATWCWFMRAPPRAGGKRSSFNAKTKF